MEFAEEVTPEPIERPKPSSEAEIKGSIFKRMEQQGFLQPVLDEIVTYSNREEQGLRIALRKTLITDAAQMADLQMRQGRLSACAQLLTAFRTLAGRGAQHPLDKLMGAM